ncbi:MAG: histidinol dehydrogenase [Xanthomonadaceae bacterium]|jgi:histidinol dehydrogenase|nr:histidinol dehydrogenase [Xanthomonadaceae bacterium]
MKRIDWNQLDAAGRREALARPAVAQAATLRADVARLIAQVRADGDATLRALTRRFDGVEVGELRVTAAEFDAAIAALSPDLKAAIDEAAARIEAFHRAAAPQPVSVETAPGVRCERILRPIDRVGLYVPAGSAPLPSTALMLGVPARIAGCAQVVLCSPPRADGTCDPAVLYAARRCGIEAVFKLGGAQAIAAMAYGTGSVPKCDKLFGPGNAWVTEAKQQVSLDAEGAAIDMPAGPSEVLVIADAHADPRFVAADLLSQAEHGPDSQVVLVTDTPAQVDAVLAAVDAQVAVLPRRETALRALSASRAVVVADLSQAFAVSNEYAPEHLILQVREPRQWLPLVSNAGSVFLGAWTPESVGDYCSGTNHVLPTYGHARAYSGVSVASFVKAITVQELSREGLATIGPCTMTLARAEGLGAHERAVSLRLAAMEDAA